MRGPRDRAVVLDRAEPHRYGAAQPGQLLDQRDRVRGRTPRAASPPRAGRRRAPRSRPAGRTARCRPSGGRRRTAPRPATPGHRRQRPGLHAADVGDDRAVRRGRSSAAAITSARGGRAGPRRRRAAAGRRRCARPPGAQAGRGADVVGGLVGRAAPRARRGAAASPIEVPSRPVPMTSTGPVSSLIAARSGVAGPGSGRVRSAAAPCR